MRKPSGRATVQQKIKRLPTGARPDYARLLTNLELAAAARIFGDHAQEAQYLAYLGGEAEHMANKAATAATAALPTEQDDPGIWITRTKETAR